MLNDKWTNILEKIDFAFQPIVSIKSGKLFAVEALLRNHYEAGGYDSIFALFDDAYSDEVLYQLDIELRKRALIKFVTIDAKNIQLFYNLDNRLLYMPDFSQGNTSIILENLNLDKKTICFELSERGTLTDSHAISSMVKRYKQEGFDIAIDDFGTGIAGFQLLYYSEANYIKIDRFFISNIQNDTKKRLFCASIINMSHIMGIKVIAEGIETLEEYYVCKDIGADLLQGYFIQKPTKYPIEILDCYDIIKESYKNDKRVFETNKIDKNKINYIEPMRIDTSLHDLILYFTQKSTATFVPIVDGLNNLYGIIYEKDIKQIAYSQYGMALAKNSNSCDKIKTFIKEPISCELHWGVDKALEIYNIHEYNSNGIFITKNNKYIGFIDVNNLLSIAYNRNLEMAKDQNPLTKLSGNQQIENFINQAFITKETCHIVYFDFNDFKPYNDLYGFRQGDRAILLFADILKKELSSDVFIGHIGGDDFFLGYKKSLYEDVYSDALKIQNLFKENVKQFYNETDRETGFITTKDRFGEIRKFELLSVCSAIVEITKRCDKNDLDALLGQIKKISKTMEIPLGISIIKR
ncbi:MAG: GGDEF domain-containing protein [Arcobacteraceae bacterium]|nr:GGDEF domain-containing protein [Arcobacteraceae bacterium]